MNDQSHFQTILASSIHDIKNSLTMVRELIMQVAAKQQSRKNQDFIQLEFEVNRMNSSLIQLLQLYKIDSDKFSLEIDEYAVTDIFQEIKAQQSPLLKLNKLRFTLDCPENLFCYCDYDHICNALSSILNNAQRYTNSQILLSAYQEQGSVVFCMEDDGEGYPKSMLTVDITDLPANKWVSGSTCLGLYFVATIAKLHQSQGRGGFIKIDNNSVLGGARFRLFLP